MSLPCRPLCRPYAVAALPLLRLLLLARILPFLTRVLLFTLTYCMQVGEHEVDSPPHAQQQIEVRVDRR